MPVGMRVEGGRSKLRVGPHNYELIASEFQPRNCPHYCSGQIVRYTAVRGALYLVRCIVEYSSYLVQAIYVAFIAVCCPAHSMTPERCRDICARKR